MATTADFNAAEEIVSSMNQTLHKPKVSLEMAIRWMKKLYGLEVTEINEIKCFEDQNFHVKVSTHHCNPHIDQVCDSGYTLKVINSLKSTVEEHFNSMHMAIQHLNIKGLRVPLPVKNLEGKNWSLENVPSIDKDELSTEKKCGVYLYTYIPGVPVAVIDNTPENLFQWGVLLAKFHKALEDFECPYFMNKFVPSNLKFLPLVENFMESLDESTKSLIFPVLKRYSHEVAEKLLNLPKGFIHGDFHESNVLAQLNDPASKTYTIDGILDLEYIHYGTYAWDLGMILAHASLVSKTLDSLDAAGFALAGYRTVRSLSQEEISVLKICMECRLCQTLVFCAHCSKLDPENAHISNQILSEEKCTMLDTLSKHKSEDLFDKWNDIYISNCSNKTLNL